MSEVLPLLLRLNLVAAAAIAVVLALRPMVSRLWGARVRYTLWLLVPAAVAASLLPARTELVAAPVLPAASIPASAVQFHLPIGAATPAAAVDWPALLLPLWLGGVLVCLVRMIGRQRAFMQNARQGSGGPAVVGFLKPRIWTPHDFERQFEDDERALILAHERVHLRRNDARINGLAALAQCLCWFNPLVHVAARLARLDQELSCDEAVAAAYPHARAAYARAMLKTQLATHPLPLGCYWPARGVHPLEQRIAMLKKTTPKRSRRAAGIFAVATAALAAGAAAWAAQPPRATTAPQALPTSTPNPVRRIARKQAAEPKVQAPAATSTPVGDVCLANSCAPTVLVKEQVSLDAALRDRNAWAALQAGASPEQFLDLLQATTPAQSRHIRNLLNFMQYRDDGSTLRRMEMSGSPMIARYDAEGHLVMALNPTPSGTLNIVVTGSMSISDGSFSATAAEKAATQERPEPPPAPSSSIERRTETVIQDADWVHKPTFNQMMAYTRLGDLRRKVQGEVVLRCGVQASGSVKDCAVVSESNPAADLGKSVLRTTKWFKIKSPKVNGEVADNATVLIPFRFNLRQV